LAIENERVTPSACTSTYCPGAQVNSGGTASVTETISSVSSVTRVTVACASPIGFSSR